MTTPPAPARLFVLLARQAPIGVILRRGPSDWVQMIKWHTDTDTFEAGQWIKARVYENKCDLSPDGKLFIYFVHKGGSYRADPDFSRHTWTAISKPPYFTALTLWKEFGTWGGGGRFLDNKTVRINVPSSYQHPDRPIVGLTVLDSESEDIPQLENDENPLVHWHEEISREIDDYDAYQTFISTNGELAPENDWYQLSDKEKGGKKAEWFGKNYVPSIYSKTLGNCTLETRHFGYRVGQGNFRKFHVLDHETGKRFSLNSANWADFDPQGRLVLAKEGKLFAATLDGDNLNLTELADFNANKPDPQPAPEWAQKW